MKMRLNSSFLVKIKLKYQKSLKKRFLQKKSISFASEAEFFGLIEVPVSKTKPLALYFYLHYSARTIGLQEQIQLSAFL